MGGARSGGTVCGRSNSTLWESTLSGRSRRSSKAFVDHGCSSFQGHAAGNGCTSDRSWAGISLSASCGEPTWETRFSLSRASQSHLRSRLLLASTQGMSVCDISEDAYRFLGVEVRRERGSGSKGGEGTQETWLVGSYDLAMQVEGLSKTGKTTR
jgi:hypothetical protein